MAENEKKSNVKGILIALLVLLLIANIGQFLWNYQKSKEQLGVITDQKESIDSLQVEKAAQLEKITQLESDLALAIDEKEKLGLDVEELKEKLEKIKKEKAYYAANFFNPKVRKEMEAKIVNYELMLNQQNDEIRLLKAKNDSLFKNTIELKDVIVQKQDTIQQLAKVKQEQQVELDKGRVLRAVGFKIKAIKNPSKNRIIEDDENIYKNSEMVQTLIEFNIDENPIAFIGEKELFIQVIGPDKKVIYDSSTGGGNFTVGEKNMNYSIKQNIMYKRDSQSITLIFDKPADYQVGTQEIKVWCEGHMIGTGSFNISK